MTWITLNEPEQSLARDLAQRREANNRKYTAQNNRAIGPAEQCEKDLQAIGAEIAYCKLFNVYPDTDTELHPKDFPHEDCTLHDGTAVDVKQTKWAHGHLLVERDKNPKTTKVDIYVLMVGEFPRYRYCGRMTKDQLLHVDRLKDLGYGPTFAAKQKELDA